jgi:DNA-binding HxlR family transcriptional regulator
MTGYGQFCPVAKAMELLDERWTLLVIRELLAGSTHFNELRRGVPRMSPALLSKRLSTLTRAGVVAQHRDGGRTRYELTPAGRELEPVVQALGEWGIRWVPDLGDADLDPHLLLWDIHRNLRLDAVPPGRTVLEFSFSDVPPPAARWWLVVTQDQVDVCESDPGHPVTAALETDLRTLTALWLGNRSWSGEIRRGTVVVRAPSQVRRDVPRWLGMSAFAAVPRGRPAPDTLDAPAAAAAG